jgi:phage protein D
MINPLESVCAVWVQGLELSDRVLRDILNLTITYREKKAADGSITLSDPEFRYFDSKIFSKNHKLAFILGLTDDSIPMGPFIIKALSVDAGDDGAPTLTVNFQDLTHTLNKAKKKTSFTGSCVDRAKQAATSAEAGYDIETPKGVIFDEEKKLIQAHKTDAAVMNSLAERYGFVWGIEGKTLYFRRPRDLDEIGRQNFIPVLSYRINDFSLFSYRANFNFTKEGVRDSSKKKTENIDFEKCDLDVGNYIEDYYSGKLADIPDDIKALLDSYKSKSQQPSEEVGQKKSVEKLKDAFDAIKGLSSGGSGDTGTDLNTLSTIAADGFSSFATGGADYFKDPPSDIETKVRKSFGIEENTETGSGDASGTATPDSAEEAKKREEAHLYRAVTVCEASFIPTIPSPRYKPTMAVILAGMGERLSGKYRLTEVTHTYSGDSAYKTDLRAEKRLYGASDDDKKKIVAATAAIAQGDTSSSTPGGSDKVYEENDRVSVSEVSGKLYEGYVKMVDGKPEE